MKNKVNLIGRVGNDPEVRVINDTNKVAKISLATNETWKDKSGEKQERVEWHNLEAWDKKAEIIELFVKKGDLIDIEGKLIYQKWEKDGQKHERAVIRVDNLLMLGGKKPLQDETSSNQSQNATSSNSQESSKSDSKTEDLPF